MDCLLRGLAVELVVGIEFVKKQLELVLDAEHARRLLDLDLRLFLLVLSFHILAIVFGLSVRLLNLLRRLSQSLEELFRRIWGGIVPKRLNYLHCKIEVQN